MTTSSSKGGAGKKAKHAMVLHALGEHLKGDPRRMLWRVLENGPATWWPGVDSHDPRYHAFMLDAIERLNAALPAEVDDDSYASSNAIPSTFDSARALPGHQMPFPYALVDNAVLREELKVQEGWKRPRHKLLFDKLHELMFSVAVTDASARFNPVASMALPTGKNGKVFKSAKLQDIAADFDGYMRDLAAPSIKAWAARHAFPLTLTVGRLQNDSWSNGQVKTRYLPSYEYAMSGGRKGSRAVANRDVIVNGRLLEGFATKRARVAYAVTGVANMLGTIASCQARAGYYARLGYTFHHTTPDAIAAKLAHFAQVFAFDATNYDTTFPRDKVEYMLECDGRYFSEEYVALKRHVWFQHVWQAPTVPGDRDSWLCSWTNDRDAFDHSTFVGLPSGAWFNPDMGKFFMTWDLLCTFDDVLGDVLENMESILRGQDLRLGILNASDDVRIGIADHPALNEATKRWKAGERPTTYFAAEYGKGSFLGNVFYKDGGRVMTAPSMVSFFGNFFSPERPLSHPSRRFWALGWLERKKHYSSAPGARDAFAIVDDCFARHFPGLGTLDGIASAEHLRTMNAHTAIEEARLTSGLSALDYEVLMDPTKLYWRVEEDDLHPSVLAALTLNLPGEVVSKLTKNHYRGLRTTKKELHHE